MAGSGREVDRPDFSGFPLHTCELCGQDGLTEPDMRSHMLVTHVQTSPACPFCDLGKSIVPNMYFLVSRLSSIKIRIYFDYDLF